MFVPSSDAGTRASGFTDSGLQELERRKEAMYQLNELDLWHQRRDELLREAENERLARHLRAARPRMKQLGRAAAFSLGLVAMLTLVVVLTTLTAVMMVATAFPAPAGPAALTR
jgi:hypothetical protein